MDFSRASQLSTRVCLFHFSIITLICLPRLISLVLPPNHPSMARSDAVRRVKSYSAADACVSVLLFCRQPRPARHQPWRRGHLHRFYCRQSTFPPSESSPINLQLESWPAQNGLPFKLGGIRRLQECASIPALVNESNLEDLLRQIGHLGRGQSER